LRRNWFWPAVTILLAFMALCMGNAALEESQTFDEAVHLVAGFSYWTRGDYRLNEEHPPLSKLLGAAPLLFTQTSLPEREADWKAADQLALSHAFLYRNRLSAGTMLFLGRLTAVTITLCLGLAIAVWTRRRVSAAAGVLALVFLATDANFLAHGHYVTSDVLSALTFFLAAVTWAEYLESGKRSHLICATFALGAALASKYSALYLIPVHLLLFLIYGRQKRRLLPVLVGAVLILGITYAPETLRSFEKGPLSEHINLDIPAGVKARALAEQLKLPAHPYLVGMWRLFSHNEEGQQSYLLGQIRREGDWRYFPVAFAVKTPTGLLILTAMSLAAIPWRRWSPVQAAFVLYPMIYFAWCLNSRLNIGHRHILPIYLFLFVGVSAVFLTWWRPRWPRLATAVLIGAVALQAAELARVHPYYLAFFNTAAGGPRNGPRYLLDSNIDWGQDLARLKAWMERNKLDSVCLSYFGMADLEYYGIREYSLLNMTAQDRKEFGCVAAVSQNNLYDLYHPPGTHAWAREMTPFGHIGYSILLYDLRGDRSVPFIGLSDWR